MRTLAILCLVGVGLVTLPETHATAQRGDVLIVDGAAYSIHTNPLEPYLETNPDLRPESPIVSTSLWRRYVATWEILDGQLLLLDIESLRQKPGVYRFEAELHSVMSSVFPTRSQVLAEWFTGHIVVPRGELEEYVHMGYASTFESYLVFTVADGFLQASRRMTERQFRRFRKTQFRAYQRTEEYEAAFDELMQDQDWTASEIREFLFEVESVRYLSMRFD